MTIERSHGKARPTLVRSSDLAPVETARDPAAGRDASGRFGPGNRVSIGQGWKAVVRRMLGKGASDPEAVAVQRDTVKLFRAIVRELPSDGATVRQLAALQARHTALSAFYGAKAAELGLGSEAGVQAAEQSTKHGQRAERLAVTCLDVATKMAAAAPAVLTPAEEVRRRLAGAK